MINNTHARLSDDSNACTCMSTWLCSLKSLIQWPANGKNFVTPESVQWKTTYYVEKRAKIGQLLAKELPLSCFWISCIFTNDISPDVLILRSFFSEKCHKNSLLPTCFHVNLRCSLTNSISIPVATKSSFNFFSHFFKVFLKLLNLFSAEVGRSGLLAGRHVITLDSLFYSFASWLFIIWSKKTFLKILNGCY